LQALKGKVVWVVRILNALVQGMKNSFSMTHLIIDGWKDKGRWENDDSA
jgi:hypothetical protein